MELEFDIKTQQRLCGKTLPITSGEYLYMIISSSLSFLNFNLTFDPALILSYLVPNMTEYDVLEEYYPEDPSLLIRSKINFHLAARDIELIQGHFLRAYVSWDGDWKQVTLDLDLYIGSSSEGRLVWGAKGEPLSISIQESN
ncbi:hypothetical protein Neosp_001805 [[Neocosmospora] mangrovei]